MKIPDPQIIIAYLILPLLIFACDPCRNVDCENGTCTEGNCICDDDWEGTHCEDRVPCFGIDCSENGVCYEGECLCESRWSGDFCEIDNLCNNTCEYANNGVCEDGGPNAQYNACICGSDCADCGERTKEICENVIPPSDAAVAVYTSIETFPCNSQRMNISINGSYAGALTRSLNKLPNCGDIGTVTAGVPHGTVELLVECVNGIVLLKENIEVEAGYCVILELTDQALRNFKAAQGE